MYCRLCGRNFGPSKSAENNAGREQPHFLVTRFSSALFLCLARIGPSNPTKSFASPHSLRHSAKCLHRQSTTTHEQTHSLALFGTRESCAGINQSSYPCFLPLQCCLQASAKTLSSPRTPLSITVLVRRDGVLSRVHRHVRYLFSPSNIQFTHVSPDPHRGALLQSNIELDSHTLSACIRSDDPMACLKRGFVAPT